jgi:hypothetical protein
VMQGSGCNEQIPAKIYEYLRAGRPILGLATPEGDTSAALRNAGVVALADLESADAIVDLLPGFVDALRTGAASGATAVAAARASRRGRTAVLAGWLDGLRRPGARA